MNTIRNEDHVGKIMTYIKDNRDVKVEKTIKRTYNK